MKPMKESRSKELDLLGEVLNERGYATFRDELRERCLRELRSGRKRRTHDRTRTSLVAAAAAILIGAGLITYWLSLPRPRPRPGPGATEIAETTAPAAPQSRFVIRSRPLSSEQVVRTTPTWQRPAPTEPSASSSQPGANEPERIVHTGAGPLTISTPAFSPRFERISDQQLLALFENTSCGLIERSGGRKELIFFRREDRERYFPETRSP